ncbi:spermatogenesis-associated serine-rich protein 1 [Pelobates fuscus]|uniref:spermatogenesis-associated serine-rich protein 1 n=1 Tax=Pelobates fuscus TaxID=191477 RepID=UPI002FE4FA02
MWSITQRIRSSYMTNDKNMLPKENLAEMGEGQLAKVEEMDIKELMQHGCDTKTSVRLQDWFYDPDEEYAKRISLPPIKYIMSTHPNCDLNWKPTARWLPSPRYSDAPFPHIKDCKFPESIKLLRSYPRSKSGIHPEWTFYPTLGFPFTYHDGKRCTFQGIHFSNRASEDRQILPACLGRKKKVIDPRNGIPEANPGDKPFHTPEYSNDFHKFGSTRPLVNFKSSYKVKADTFIPLLKMPQTPCVPYRIKAQHQIKKEEKREVEELNDWKPSTRSFHFDIPSTVQKT